MASIEILGQTVPISFRIGDEATIPMDEPGLTAAAEAMARRINDAPWEPAHPEYAAALRGLRGIVFFEGIVEVNGHRMDRPCMDEDDAVFYWESSEFTKNPLPEVQAQTLFHDCWHIVQFKAGGMADGPAERVAREKDAIDHQIEAAEILGCYPELVAWLKGFRDTPGLIEARLEEGVEDKIYHARRPRPGFA
ncbi:MAG: hypothetical protein JWQ29_2752 [Phenylobacterium sp.]|nr:hypothetical protein [Phenylobacterium sp.]